MQQLQQHADVFMEEVIRMKVKSRRKVCCTVRWSDGTTSEEAKSNVPSVLLEEFNNKRDRIPSRRHDPTVFDLTDQDMDQMPQ